MKKQDEPRILQKQEAIALLKEAHEENIRHTCAKVNRQGHPTERDLDRLGFSIHQLVLLEGGVKE